MDDLFVFVKNLNMRLTLILYLYAGKPNYYYLLYYSYYSTVLNAVQCQITIVEHPSSLLVPVNETAVFSCTAHVQCNFPPCRLRGKSIVNKSIFSRSQGDNELTLNWRINNSNIMRNTSEVRCHFSYGNRDSEESKTAFLKWIDGELLCMYIRMHY